MDRFFCGQTDDSFAEVFVVFSPQLVAFYRARGCTLAVAEELSQEVMLTVFLKATQLRDRALFRGWLFKIARHALCRHYGKQAREVDTASLEGVSDRFVVSHGTNGPPAFEFMEWMAFLNSLEREVMTLRFVEAWEYHEIAAAQNIPIGTVQWRVFNSKKKLAPYLSARQAATREAA